MRHVFIAAFAAMLWMNPAAAVAQQETATIIGSVLDAQRSALPGATISARNTETGFVRTGVSDQEGRYRIAAIPPGSYEISAELQGFGRAVRRGITLTVGAESVIHFDMTVAGVTEQVTVQADAPVIETTTSA
nr:carboxypeptidase regulatory-like domain-containing protein [Acidobacteriota bacterium]